jgi:hypothetical protein
MRFGLYATIIILVIFVASLIWSLSTPRPYHKVDHMYDGFMRGHVDYPTPLPMDIPKTMK